MFSFGTKIAMLRWRVDYYPAMKKRMPNANIGR